MFGERGKVENHEPIYVYILIANDRVAESPNCKLGKLNKITDI